MSVEATGSMTGRLGIFGGTFDPPHIGHLVLAGEALHAFALEKVLWVLTPDPPHKEGQSILAAAQRLRMLEIAIEGNAKFEVCRVDIDRPAPHYALESMLILRGRYPQASLYYLIGGDSLRDLPTWHQPGELLAVCDALGVMRRPADQIDLPRLETVIPGLDTKLAWMDAPMLDISSSDIRQRVAEGRPFRYFLRERVYKYICQERLYRYNYS